MTLWDRVIEAYPDGWDVTLHGAYPTFDQIRIICDTVDRNTKAILNLSEALSAMTDPITRVPEATIHQWIWEAKTLTDGGDGGVGG